MNKISLITVCYNAVDTIEKTIQSVLSQNNIQIEYIVIDGHSKDGTKAILNRYKQQIDILISEPDDGIYHAMNKGICMATGDIIGFLNADDIFAHQNVLIHVSKAFNSPFTEAVFADLTYFKTDPFKTHRYWRTGEFRAGAFARGWSPAHPTFYVRRHVYQRFGGFNLTLPTANDVELMMRFLEKYRINAVYIPEVWVKMRMGGISNRSWTQILKQNRIIIKSSRDLGLSFSWLPFIIGKLFYRIQQRRMANT